MRYIRKFTALIIIISLLMSMLGVPLTPHSTLASPGTLVEVYQVPGEVHYYYIESKFEEEALPEAPTVVTNDATGVTTSSATLNGDLTDLSPNTTYYFRAKAVGDGTSYGDEKSFTTEEEAWELKVLIGDEGTNVVIELERMIDNLKHEIAMKFDAEEAEMKLEYKEEASAEAKFEIKVVVSEVIEYLDENGNGAYDPEVDTVVGGFTLSELQWDPLTTEESTVDDVGGWKIIGRAALDDVSIFGLNFYVFGRFAEVGGTSIEPTAMKIDILIQNYPYTEENSLLALWVKTEMSSEYEVETVDGGVTAKFGELTGYFTWKPTYIIDGNVQEVKVTITESETEIAGESYLEEKAYFSYGRGDNIFHDPVLGITREAPPEDTTPPTVTVTSPNGGEFWAGGSLKEITWTATDDNMADNPITIEYYDGSGWQTIASNEANDGSYTWTVPSLNIANAKVRITAIDKAGNTISEESDADFIIDSTAPAKPSLEFPANGARVSDTTPTLDWSDVTDPSEASYSLQIDDNADFSSPVISEEEIAQSNYTLPDDKALSQGTYYWRVKAIDRAGNTLGWTAPFSFAVAAPITPPPVNMALIIGIISGVAAIAIIIGLSWRRRRV